MKTKKEVFKKAGWAIESGELGSTVELYPKRFSKFKLPDYITSKQKLLDEEQRQRLKELGVVKSEQYQVNWFEWLKSSLVYVAIFIVALVLLAVGVRKL